MNDKVIKQDEILFADLCNIIDNTRHRVATVANSGVTLMYWGVGNRINTDVLDNKRAEYGKQIVVTVSRQLQEKYNTNEFEEKKLRRMMQFASLLPDHQIVVTLSQQLSWSHFVATLPLKDEVQREFYLTMASSERWGVRTLRERIDSMLYERTLISGKPEEFIKTELAKLRDENVLSPDWVFKSPYFLDFTGLKGFYREKDLESMLVAELQQFILELGKGFSFVERQKRMTIDGEDFKLDLLFYHRKLKRLIAIDLKLGKFKAAYKGQMELYLRWLDKYERQEGEESPLGLLLCSEGGQEQIELLKLGDAGIQVSQYYTELPDKKLLQEHLHRQIEIAHERVEMQLDKE